MGKILVYKSGKVKMRIGDALFDVSIEAVNCYTFFVFAYMFCRACTKNNKLGRYLLASTVCSSRRLQRLTPEKNTAAPWERSVSVRL